MKNRITNNSNKVFFKAIFNYFLEFHTNYNLTTESQSIGKYNSIQNTMITE